MDELLLSGLLAVALLAFLASGVWVAFALMACGWVAIALFTGRPVGQVLASSVWGASAEWALAALPLFIWMGEILFRSRLSSDLFTGLVPWMARLPGRLLHTNILACGIFAAVSGSSAATAATIGKMSLPELQRRGYHERMTIGTLAGSATLGLLIPPSIILIVYGVAIEESIARLFMAGVVPGLMLMALFMLFVGVWSLLNTDKVPPPDGVYSWRERLVALKRLAPVVGLILGVIGSIYFGIASPTDAAAVGVALALLLSWSSGTLTRESFKASLLGATRTSCMIAFILAGAAFLTTAMGFTGLPRELAAWIGELQLSRYELIFVLTLFFIVLGCFLDGISVVVLTTAIVLPMIDAAGIDRIWFGIYVVVVVEMSQITPPVGFNLFVIQGLTGRNILQVAYAALPFFLIMVLAVVLLVIFPELATWLPTQMTAR